MRRIHVFILLAMTVLTVSVWVAALMLHQSHPEVTLPTRVILPSFTPTHTPTPTRTLTPTSTVTVTSSLTTTLTPSPTLTPTLSVRVIELHAVMPGVDIPPTPTDFPFGTILLPAPPQPIEPLPDATYQPPPYIHWYSFESDHPLVQYFGTWTPQLNRDASRGQYHHTEHLGDSLRFVFEGEAFRLRYVAATNMGQFEIRIDGVRLDVIHAESSERHFPGTQVYFVGSGLHVLEIYNIGNHTVGIDAIQVFRGTENTLIIPPSSHSPTPQPRPAVDVELVSAPPTIQPTSTPVSPGLLTVSVVIAYDENGNRAVDPAEGVAGISVRMVEVGTNQVISQAFTDVQGFAQLQVVTSVQARVVVPYFSKVWEMPRNRHGGEAAFTLLLQPGNQPGLIP